MNEPGVNLEPGDKVIIHYLLQPDLEAEVVTPPDSGGWVELRAEFELGQYEFFAAAEMVERL